MALPVSLAEVANELDALMEGMVTYVHRGTGELATLTEEMREWAESEDSADLPGWMDESEIEKLREIIDLDDWVALPDSFEIHEWEIMRAFADTVADDPSSEELNRALRGRGAFRHFKDVLRRRGLENRWFAFKQKALENIAREALEAKGIPYL